MISICRSGIHRYRGRSPEHMEAACFSSIEMLSDGPEQLRKSIEGLLLGCRTASTLSPRLTVKERNIGWRKTHGLADTRLIGLLFPVITKTAAQYPLGRLAKGFRFNYDVFTFGPQLEYGQSRGFQ